MPPKAPICLRGHVAVRNAARMCKECARETARGQRAQRKALIDDIKMSRGCADCGFNWWPEALDFDHLDPDAKAFSIAEAVTKNLQLVLDEIDKCAVVCANCHRHRTVQRLKHVVPLPQRVG